MNTQKETFWVGDLCYVMGDDWDEVGDLVSPTGGYGVYGLHTLKDGRKFVIFGTAYGDGRYNDQFGNSYPVDSGTIGAILKSDIKGWDNIHGKRLGNLHELDPKAVYDNSSYGRGIISIAGEVNIDTDD